MQENELQFLVNLLFRFKFQNLTFLREKSFFFLREKKLFSLKIVTFDQTYFAPFIFN